MTTREFVCTYINEWLKTNHVTNKAFGEKLGVSDVSVNRWRTGVCAPDLNLLPKMCEVMGITINELLDMPCGNITPEQISFIDRYVSDANFKALVDSYRDDDEMRLSLDYIVKLKNK